VIKNLRTTLAPLGNKEGAGGRASTWGITATNNRSASTCKPSSKTLWGHRVVHVDEDVAGAKRTIGERVLVQLVLLGGARGNQGRKGVTFKYRKPEPCSGLSRRMSGQETAHLGTDLIGRRNPTILGLR